MHQPPRLARQRKSQRYCLGRKTAAAKQIGHERAGCPPSAPKERSKLRSVDSTAVRNAGPIEFRTDNLQGLIHALSEVPIVARTAVAGRFPTQNLFCDVFVWEKILAGPSNSKYSHFISCDSENSSETPALPRSVDELTKLKR